jgi:hypothetical protein
MEQPAAVASNKAPENQDPRGSLVIDLTGDNDALVYNLDLNPKMVQQQIPGILGSSKMPIDIDALIAQLNIAGAADAPILPIRRKSIHLQIEGKERCRKASNDGAKVFPGKRRSLRLLKKQSGVSWDVTEEETRRAQKLAARRARKAEKAVVKVKLTKAEKRAKRAAEAPPIPAGSNPAEHAQLARLAQRQARRASRAALRATTEWKERRLAKLARRRAKKALKKTEAQTRALSKRAARLAARGARSMR